MTIKYVCIYVFHTRQLEFANFSLSCEGRLRCACKQLILSELRKSYFPESFGNKIVLSANAHNRCVKSYNRVQYAWHVLKDAYQWFMSVVNFTQCGGS